MWIETLCPCRDRKPPLNSFASNGECGLKLVKLVSALPVATKIHSPAMANVD